MAQLIIIPREKTSTNPRGGGWPIGLPMSNSHKKKISVALKSKKKSPQHCTNNGLAKKGQIPWNKGLKGVQVSTRKGISQPQFRGRKPWNWTGNTTTKSERRIAMGQIEYKLWRIAVFERDNYTCQGCGERGGELNADHIKPWALYPELRYAIDNGRTLCVSCHRKTFIFMSNQFIRRRNYLGN